MSFIDPFVSPAQAALLRLMFRRPSQHWSQHQLARELQFPRTTVEHQLHRLVRATVIAQQQSGRTVQYWLNDRCPIRQELESMLLKSYGIVEEIRETLLPFEKGIKWSFVRDIGADFRNSDVTPVAHVIGVVDYEELRPRLVKLMHRLARPVHVDYQYTGEFEPHVRLRHPIAMDIINCEKIWLQGDPKTLLKLKRQRPRKDDRIIGPPPTLLGRSFMET